MGFNTFGFLAMVLASFNALNLVSSNNSNNNRRNNNNNNNNNDNNNIVNEGNTMGQIMNVNPPIILPPVSGKKKRRRRKRNTKRSNNDLETRKNIVSANVGADLDGKNTFHGQKQTRGNNFLPEVTIWSSIKHFIAQLQNSKLAAGESQQVHENNSKDIGTTKMEAPPTAAAATTREDSQSHFFFTSLSQNLEGNCTTAADVAATDHNIINNSSSTHKMKRGAAFERKQEQQLESCYNRAHVYFDIALAFLRVKLAHTHHGNGQDLGKWSAAATDTCRRRAICEGNRNGGILREIGSLLIIQGACVQ